jgi:hypothetical protein
MLNHVRREHLIHEIIERGCEALGTLPMRAPWHGTISRRKSQCMRLR